MNNIEYVAFPIQVNSSNIRKVIASANPETMSSFGYKRLTGYFADYFRSAELKEKVDNGSTEIKKIYSHAANVFDKISGQKTLEYKASTNKALFSLIYLREENFRAFADKFLPDLMVVCDKETSQSNASMR